VNTPQAPLQHIVLDTVTASVPGGPGATEAEMVVSTPGRDRMGDRVMLEGADLTRFRRNPVLLWGHEANFLPIGTVTQLTVEPARGLRARWRCLVGDAFADRVKNAWEQGIVRAASIGFMPIEGSPNKLGGYDHRMWELLEISLVPIPANAEATRPPDS
jgi:HK97 family phage prohead protease